MTYKDTGKLNLLGHQKDFDFSDDDIDTIKKFCGIVEDVANDFNSLD